ncbi:MAG: hypothetical protein KGZ74_00745 [Chitinophagaceae bacterium]|nr:hypothetical protein [Chitinophagaceae bacterium]
MITPKELINKANKQFFKIVSSELKSESIFPLLIPANKKISGTNFSELSAAIVPLYQQSKQAKGKGYSVEWKEKVIEGTKHKVPAKIYFETIEDYLFSTGRANDFASITQSYKLLTNTFSTLKDWAIANTSFILNNAAIMEDLVRVCKYFHQNKPPHNLYLRELPVEVHSKFIEDNSGQLRKLLDILLQADWINNSETDFCSRYYVKKPAVYAQMRVLDDALKPSVGFDELALTLDDSALLDWKPAKVFIIENKACFLSFPKVKNAVAIFGEGFKSRISKHIPWLEKTELYCWFDLDAAGFEMLNIIRQYYPNAKSFLMDEETYNQFSQFSVNSAYRKLPLEYLNTTESKLYELLLANSKRLEQERVSNYYISERLKTI